MVAEDELIAQNEAEVVQNLDKQSMSRKKRKNSQSEDNVVKKQRKKEPPVDGQEKEDSKVPAENAEESVQSPPKRHRKRKRHYFNAIRSQMEFYFGDANLSKDRYLKKLILQDPFVPLEVFMTFNKMKGLAKSVEEIAKSLSNSNMLVLDESGLKVRRNTKLPEERNVDKNTIYVESLPVIANHDWVREIFERFGAVSYVSLPKYSKSRKIKEFGFVEFENEGSVTKTVNAFKEFNGVLNMETQDPAELSSVTSFIKEQKEEDNQADVKTTEENMSVKHDNSSKSGSSVDMSDGASTDNKLEATDMNKKKKKLRKKKKKSKCLKEQENELILTADAAYFELKILPKLDWKRLRNKYLNLQRQKLGELKRKAWQERQSQQQQQQQQLVSSGEQDCNENTTNERKIHAGMNMNFYGAGDDESLPIKGTKEAKHNPALERAPHFTYEKGLIVEITLLEPCVNIKEFKANMRQYATVKYVDIKEGSQTACLRLESATAAEEFVERMNSAEYVCRVLTDEQDAAYWQKIDQDREAKLNKQLNLPQKRGREKVKKLITQHIRFQDEE